MLDLQLWEQKAIAEIVTSNIDYAYEAFSRAYLGYQHPGYLGYRDYVFNAGLCGGADLIAEEIYLNEIPKLLTGKDSIGEIWTKELATRINYKQVFRSLTPH
jgi:hypothetical protein